MKKRTSLIVILLSAVLMISMMSAVAFAKDKGDMLRYEKRAATTEGISLKAARIPLFVGGVGVQATTTETVIDGVVEEGGTATVVFNGEGEDATEATLTLNNAVVHGEGKDPEDPSDDRYDIIANGIDLTIVLAGDNTVGDSNSGNAIRSFAGDKNTGDINIKGSGSDSKLTVTGETCGINAAKKVCIENTSVEVKSKTAEAITAWYGKDETVISIKDSDVTAEITDCNYSSDFNAAINAYYGGMVIDGSKVTATTTCNERDKKYSYAIFSNDDTAISNSTVTATVNNAGKYCDAIYAYNDLTISGNSTSVTAATNCADGAIGCSGMYAHGNNGGSVKISGAQVEAAVNVEENGSLKNSGAIYSAKGISLTGGTVSAVVNGVGEYNDAVYTDDGNVEISGGQVEATVINGIDECCGIYADKDVIINDAAVTAATDAGRALEGANVNIDNSLVSAEGDYCAVSSSRDINIKDSKIKDAKGQFYADGKLVIQDSKTDVSAESDVLVGNAGIDIKYTESGKYSTYVEAKAGGLQQSGFSAKDAGYPDLAVHAKADGLKISANLAITKPKGGEIGNYGKDEDAFATVMNGENYAAHAVIQPSEYDITIDATTGGKVKAEPDKAGEGETVKVIATPARGYGVRRIIIVDEEGNKTDITKKSTFTMGNSDVTVKVTFRKKAAKPVAAVRGIAKGRTALKFTWNKVDGAASYEIWLSKCNISKKKYSMKKVKTLSAVKTTWTKKRLKKGTAYKFRVVAKDASGKVISKSLIGHAITGNVRGKYTNARSLKISKTSFTLTKGSTAKIKAKQTKAKKGKKLLDGKHAALLRYISNNSYVAKVDRSGKITAVGSGSCKVYVQTVNGIWKTVKVNVK